MPFLETVTRKMWLTLNKSCGKKKLQKIRRTVAENPDNLNSLIRFGDLLAKLGEKEEAVRIYHYAAEKYAHKNLYKQAIALNKIIVRLDPAQEESENAIADLQAKWVHMGEESIVGNEGAWGGAETSP